VGQVGDVQAGVLPQQANQALVDVIHVSNCQSRLPLWQSIHQNSIFLPIYIASRLRETAGINNPV
jgi:hypothetical protein